LISAREGGKVVIEGRIGLHENVSQRTSYTSHEKSGKKRINFTENRSEKSVTVPNVGKLDAFLIYRC